MRPIYVIDTSVFMADAQPVEPHHFEASAILSRAAQEQWLLVAPVIMLAEVAASIARNTNDPLLAHHFVSSLTNYSHMRQNENHQCHAAGHGHRMAQHHLSQSRN
jgi:predicted nucleic acid-binding protein